MSAEEGRRVQRRIPLTVEDFRVADDQIERCANQSIQTASLLIQDRHGIQRSEGYWHALLGRFAYEYAYTITTKQMILDHISETYLNPPIEVHSPRTASAIVPKHVTEFVDLAHRDLQFNSSLFTYLLAPEVANPLQPTERKRGPQLVAASQAARDPGAVRIRDQVAPSVSPFKRMLYGAADLLGRGRVVMLGSGGWSAYERFTIPLKTRLSCVPTRPVRLPIPATTDIDVSTRTSLLEKTHPDETVRGAIRGLSSKLPTCFLEDFPSLFSAASRLADRTCPRAIVAPPIVDDEFVHYLAECVHRGADVYYEQHGGFYGESFPSARERSERMVSRQFLSWGWVDDGVVPVSSRRLRNSTIIKKPAVRGRDILWVAQSAAPLAPALPAWRPGDESYEESQLAFLRALPTGIERRITVRVRPPKYEGDLSPKSTPWFAALMSADIEVDPGTRSMQDALSNAQLVVIDRAFTTTFLECLHNDVPAILFDPGFPFLVREPSRSIYQGLLDAQVAHDTPASAISALLRAIEDPREWWSEPLRASAVARFRDRHAYVASRHNSEWLEFLRRL